MASDDEATLRARLAPLATYFSEQTVFSVAVSTVVPDWVTILELPLSRGSERLTSKSWLTRLSRETTRAATDLNAYFGLGNPLSATYVSIKRPIVKCAVSRWLGPYHADSAYGNVTTEMVSAILADCASGRSQTLPLACLEILMRGGMPCGLKEAPGPGALSYFRSTTAMPS